MKNQQTRAPRVSRALRWRYQSAVQAARVINAIGRERAPRAYARAVPGAHLPSLQPDLT